MILKILAVYAFMGAGLMPELARAWCDIYGPRPRGLAGVWFFTKFAAFSLVAGPLFVGLALLVVLASGAWNWLVHGRI